ncbi:MAG TPA: hypothetical protein VK923_14910 [Euzebyales bacterium]|nr:hypothetical protein [Euzebyales bacterium]
MPRSAVIAITVLGVAALLLSTTFALVRSAQLASSRTQIAALRSELAEAREDTPGGDAGTDATEPANPREGGGDGGLADLFSEDGGLGGLLGGDVEQLARCIQQAGPPGSDDVPDGTATEQIAQISDAVEVLRSLSFDEEPSPDFLDDARITERLAAEVREEYNEADADADQRILTALGAVPPGLDLIELQTDLLTSQVAGFYDSDTGELVVRGDASRGGLDPAAQSTLAHELEHALADQAFDLPVDITEDVTDSDAALAALSVVEGDATLTQQQFTVVGMTVAEQLGLNADPDALAAQRQLADVPHYVAQSLQFPYLTGLRFTCARYLDGGWEAVDAVYDAIPTTSAEILDPQRYGTPAIDPRDPGRLGGDWERQRTTTFGAADLLWLFEAPAGDTSRALDEPRQRALAWTGGELALWTDGDATALGVALTQEDDGVLCDAVTSWYERAFPDATDAPTRRDERMVREGPAQTAVLTCADTDVRLGIGPDLRTARALAR